MKQVLTLTILGLCWVAGLAGCQSSILPPEVAGTWKTEGRMPWTIVLAPNGTVSSAITHMGQVHIRPNQTTKTEMIDGQISTISAGECPVSYDPEKRELSVTIFIEHLDVKIGNDGFEGYSEDVFLGPVSKDGKIWQTTWISVMDYGPRFPQKEEDIVPVPLTFKKVEETKATE